ncbi:hypothetical protein YC2023_008602 [Brassica napus]
MEAMKQKFLHMRSSEFGLHMVIMFLLMQSLEICHLYEFSNASSKLITVLTSIGGPGGVAGFRITDLWQEVREEENNMSEGEQKPTPEKHEPKLETRNNLPNLQSILGGEHYPNLE